MVTGARRGIGRSIAIELAREGAGVAINDVAGQSDVEAAAEEVRALGRRVIGRDPGAATRACLRE